MEHVLQPLACVCVSTACPTRSMEHVLQPLACVCHVWHTLVLPHIGHTAGALVAWLSLTLMLPGFHPYFPLYPDLGNSSICYSSIQFVHGPCLQSIAAFHAHTLCRSSTAQAQHLAFLVLLYMWEGRQGTEECHQDVQRLRSNLCTAAFKAAHAYQECSKHPRFWWRAASTRTLMACSTFQQCISTSSKYQRRRTQARIACSSPLTILLSLD